MRWISILFLALPAAAQGPRPATPPDRPMTSQERFDWWMHTSFGPSRIASRAFTTGLSTLTGGDSEFERSFTGYGERMGVRATRIAVGRAVEASLGAVWDENPRYFRKTGAPVRSRIWHAFYSSLYAPRADGQYHFAWARLSGDVAGQYITNPFRPPGDRAWDQSLGRVGFSVVNRAGANLLVEFLPDIKRCFRRPKPSSPSQP